MSPSRLRDPAHGLTSRDSGDLWLRGHGSWKIRLAGDCDGGVAQGWHASDNAERVGEGQKVGHSVGVGVSAADGGASRDFWDNLQCLLVDPCIEGNSWARDMTYGGSGRLAVVLRVRSGHEWRNGDDGVAHVDWVSYGWV